MKQLIIKLTIFSLAALLTSCAERFPSGYVPELPQTPPSWVSLLGEPHWRIEWVDPGGYKQTINVAPGHSCPEIDLPVLWVNPVTAWPYWPEHNLEARLFKPAGALFPFDASDGRLYLSWKAGVDSVFYWELALAYNRNDSRIPANFDWLRFRELMRSETINASVREDPWLVDWRSLAERTVTSTFYQNRLVPRPVQPFTLPVRELPDHLQNGLYGSWYGTSPFAAPLFFTESETITFSVSSGINVWICTGGILRVDGKAWMFKQIGD